ncbi:unnamed protein product [Withania somnifera]
MSFPIFLLRLEIATKNVRQFSYNSLRSATDNFHPSKKIGRGFGVVYEGVLRDGRTVAIKCLSAESKQWTSELLIEINMISNIRHPNLVQLIGCCVEGGNRILVYEYLENNSLASSLLDIKASNVLIDENLHPKIGDFGLTKLFPDNVTHVSTRVAGTIGYLAPEYALLGQLTKEADVYIFRVLVLKIVSGRSSSNAAFGEGLLVLVEWLTDYPEAEVPCFIEVALFCIRSAYNQRPTMKQVIEMLSKEVKLNEKLLTSPGVYRPDSSKRSSYGSLLTKSSRG